MSKQAEITGIQDLEDEVWSPRRRLTASRSSPRLLGERRFKKYVGQPGLQFLSNTKNIDSVCAQADHRNFFSHPEDYEMDLLSELLILDRKLTSVRYSDSVVQLLLRLFLISLRATSSESKFLALLEDVKTMMPWGAIAPLHVNWINDFLRLSVCL
jgi:hypothetical protein